MKRFVIGALVLLFSVASAGAKMGYESHLVEGWRLKIWDEDNVWQSCSVDKDFSGPVGKKRINLGFVLGDVFNMVLVFEEPVFFTTGEEDVNYAFRVDGDKIFRGTARIQKDMAWLALDWDLEIVSEVQEGKKLEVKIGEKGYYFPLGGTRIALNNLLECYKLGLKSRKGN